MRKFILFLFLTLALPWASSLSAQTEQPSGAIAVEDSASQDAAIATRLRDILGELENFDDVTVTVSSGIVTLRGTALSAADIDRLNEIVGRVEGIVAIENNVTETADVVRRLNPVMERFTARMAQLLAMGPILAVALITFVVVVILGYGIARLGLWNRVAPNAFIADLYRIVIRLGFLVIGIVLALDILDATALLSTILGAAGLIGLAVGFAVRDTVENFIASVLLSIRQPFRPNDAVEINGDTGLVIRLTSRATILLSFDGNHIRIPNATVFKSRIVNFSTNDERRFMFEIGVAPDADLAMIRHIAEDTVASLPFALSDPAPSAWTDRIGDGAIFVHVTGWINQRDTSLVHARGEALRKVKAAIEAAGVDVPDTTYRIDILNQAEQTPGTPEFEAAAKTMKETAQAELAVDDDTTTPTTDALDKLVETERADDQHPDLLRENAPQE